MPKFNTILVVEDESAISDSVAYALKKEGFQPTICATGREAISLLQTLGPALVILDVGLPDMSGFDLCRLIRKTSSLPILFLTARAEEVDRILGLELGGDDYIAKPFSPRELVARVKAVLRRATTEEPSGQTKKSKQFVIDEERMCISFRGIALDLSRYEFRLLCVLIRRPGRVFSREELMNRAWETPEMSLERTVDTHIKTIRTKLRNIDATAEPIITHRGFGYALREETSEEP